MSKEVFTTHSKGTELLECTTTLPLLSCLDYSAIKYKMQVSSLKLKLTAFICWNLLLDTVQTDVLKPTILIILADDTRT